MTTFARNILLESAKRHREHADAYAKLAEQLSTIELAAAPAPIREIAAALATVGLCVVHRNVLLDVLDCLDPPPDANPRDLEDNTIAYANALRKILHPEQAAETNHELPL